MKDESRAMTDRFHFNRFTEKWQNANDPGIPDGNVRKLSYLGRAPHNLSVLRIKSRNDKIFSYILDYGGTRNAGDRDDSAGRKRQEDLRNG